LILAETSFCISNVILRDRTYFLYPIEQACFLEM
jgi:hypothetical protein